ncbi:HdeD family acid-resistance protein [Haloarcula marina]|uniref:HdeD family acid-resistance protein n=1 Tax=Haloarcula marina TaxID=2961574 RepID=UPI0020B724C7|nr:DUF308 domain-containing protein [Halomicroarcula marina]
MATDVSEQMTRGTVLGGILLAGLGVIALFTPFLTGVALTLTLGVLLVVGALLHVASAFSAGSFWRRVWQVVLGLVYAFAGISVLTNPVFGLATLTLLVITFFVVSGVTQLFWAVMGGTDGRLWLALSGGVALLLATLLWTGFPVSSVWAVGVLFGVNLIVTGVGLALHGRRQPMTVPSEEEPAQPGQV